MNPKHRFYIFLNENEAQQTEVFPNYKPDITIDTDQESAEKFYRTKLSGNLTFVRNDFDFINSQSIETQFNIIIKQSDDWGLTWYETKRGKFFKTDGSGDNDNRSIVVNVEPVDGYTEVLAGMEKEFDLIPLAPEIQPIIAQKRPLIQVYIPGDSVVSCFIGGAYWEQDATATKNYEELENKFYFSLCNLLKEVSLDVPGTPADASGNYAGKLTIQTEGNARVVKGNLNHANGQNKYYLEVQQVFWGTTWSKFGQIGVRLVRRSDGVVMHTFTKVGQGDDNFDNFSFEMDPVNGTGKASASMYTYRVYARYLVNVEKIRNLNTYLLPDDDIVNYNRNYRRAIGYNIDIASISTSFSVKPTEWGRANDGMYFMPPYSIYGEKFYPIARSTWRNASIWFSFYWLDEYLEVDGRQAFEMKDNWPVSSVISVLLGQIAPGITHEPTPEYSEILYSPQSPLTYQNFRLYITPKSNVLLGDYQKPAQKAPATLGEIKNMLRDTMRLFWHIENGKFRIEHEIWYKNGGSYSNINEVGTDLTTLINVTNKKPWSYNQNKWTFDKMDMYERLQFDWMDEVTLPFKGMPIEILSKFVTRGKIEDVSVSKFNSDIDIMLLNPGEMSSDGFGLFAAVNANGLVAPDDVFSSSQGNDGISSPKYDLKPPVLSMNGIAKFRGISSQGARAEIVFFKGNEQTGFSFNLGTFVGTKDFSVNVLIPADANTVAFRVVGQASFQFYNLEVPKLKELPFVSRMINNTSYVLQNGYMAFVTLQPNYYLYDMPSYNIKVNGEQTYAFGIQRKKKQNVEYPAQNDDPMKLVKTEIGSGSIEKMSISLLSGIAKTTLKYDTE